MADQIDYFFPGDTTIKDLYPKATIVKWEELAAAGTGILIVGQTSKDNYVIVSVDWEDLELFMHQMREGIRTAVANGFVHWVEKGDN